MSHDGHSLDGIIKRTGMTCPTVNKWRNRFRKLGVAGLKDAPRPGKWNDHCSAEGTRGPESVREAYGRLYQLVSGAHRIRSGHQSERRSSDPQAAIRNRTRPSTGAGKVLTLNSSPRCSPSSVCIWTRQRTPSC
ncbi:MAG: helix-turn-helix domain-containing protein [Flavobacteriales bacterium]|nr:helix-turn-helix domain-containing protein [Flavobacteriales bacterium]